MSRLIPKKIVMLTAAAAAFILELLPCGAVLNFAKPSEEGGGVWRSTFSYFDPICIGYARFGPPLTAILTCVLLLLTAILLIPGLIRAETGWCRAVFIVSVLALIASLTPLLNGWASYSVIGGLISVCLLVEAAVSARP